MTTSRPSLAPALSLLVAVACACSSKSDPDQPLADAGNAPAEPGADYRISAQPNLQWKRFAALEADLVRALELPPEEVCNEFGLESCIRGVHLVPLGGNDPFKTGLLESSAEPLATTPMAIDRILLSACSKRVALDREAGPKNAKVYLALDLDGDAPEPGAASAIDTVTALYQRLLGRDPDDGEVPLVAALARDEAGEPLRAADFAALACFAIGTSTEFLFF